MAAPAPLPVINKMTLERLNAWLRSAKPGEVLAYHEGFLAKDRDGSQECALPQSERLRIDTVAQQAWNANELGLLHLISRKIGPSRFEYIAVRSNMACRLPIKTSRSGKVMFRRPGIDGVDR